MTAKKVCITMKMEPKLALTRCSFHNESEVWVDAPGMETLKLKIIDEIDDTMNIETLE